MPASSSDEGEFHCKTPSPRSSASQAPPNPRHNPNEPPPRVNLHQHFVQSSRPSAFKGFSKILSGSKGHSDHRRGRSEGAQFDFGSSHHHAPNVRERVKRWQAAVEPESILEPPPICPATPSPAGMTGFPNTPLSASGRRMSSVMSNEQRPQTGKGPSGIAAMMEPDYFVELNTPLPPPKMPAVEGKAAWDSASEEEKKAQRRRAMSRDRERRLRRKRNSMPANMMPNLDGMENTGDTAEEKAEQTTSKSDVLDDGIRVRPLPVDDGIRVRPLGDDDDGIRVTPMKTKGSGSKRKKGSKEKIDGEDGSAPAPETPIAPDPKKTDTKEAPSQKADPPAPKEETRPKSDVSAKYKAWEDDGIRIFARRSPIPVRSDRTQRYNSVRQSARSVRSRRDEFEAQWRKEMAADAEFKARIRKQEAESKKYTFSTDAPADSEREPPSSLKELPPAEKPAPISQKSKWDDFDDGIRVTPMKTKTKTKTKKSSDSLERKRSKSLHQSSTSLSVNKPDNSSSKPAPLDTTQQTISSAPATPAGPRPRRDTDSSAYLSVKDRARRLEQGLGPFDFDAFSPSPAIEKLAVRTETQRAKLISSKSRTDHSEGYETVTKDSARRQKRRQIRAALKENEAARLRDSDFAVRRRKEREEKLAQAARIEAAELSSKSTKSKTPGSSSESLPLKRATSKSAPNTPRVSSESLLLKKSATSKPTPTLDSRKSLDSSLTEMFSTKPSSTHSARSTPSTGHRQQKRKDSSSFTPKLAAATSTFLKFVKEETQGRRSQRNLLDSAVAARTTADDDLTDATSSAAGSRSTPVRRSKTSKKERRIPSKARSLPVSSVNESESDTDDETDSESTTESDTEEERPRSESGSGSESGSESESSEESTSGSDEGDDDVSTVVKPATKAQVTAKATVSDPPKSPKADKKVKKRSSSSSITEEPKLESQKKPEPPKPEPAKVESAPRPKPEPKVEAKMEPKVELKKGYTASSESLKRWKTKSRHASRSSIDELMDVEPSSRRSSRASVDKPVEAVAPSPPPPSESPKPRRRIRSTPAPPRPKSFHGRTGSDGSITPTSSVVESNIDDHNPVTETEVEASRIPSDGSAVKPLRFKKRHTSRSGAPERKSSKLSTRSSTKRRRSTRTSAPSDSSAAPSTDHDREEEDWYNPEVSVKAPGLRRKYTKHADLMSILSVDMPRSRSTRKSSNSATNLRRSHGRAQKEGKKVETMKIPDLLKELHTEEVRYMQELRTLVDDVVPVLFQTVLGRADDDLRRSSSTSSARTTSTTGSGRSRSSFTHNPTKPIVDMGITLERLKTLHERMPKQDPDLLMAWANDARRVYEEYLSVWRMGFQDVVVAMPKRYEDEDNSNTKHASVRSRKELEFLHGARKEDLAHKYEGDPSTWEMPPPPADDDEEQHEKVDVAFLLKRPLVRLKALAKLFKRINYLKQSVLASSLSNGYHILVKLARRKISEEKGRLEDEAAASLDCSAVIDFHTLSPRSDIALDQARRVKARDQFQMRLFHTSGSVVECNVELILRDPTNRRNSEQEVLFVELGADGSKRLLFPPIVLSNISARTGDAAGEIVIMVRGLDQDQDEWREVMALASATAEGFEWVQMLGLVPIPPEGPFTEDQVRYPTVLETVIEESVVSSRVKSPSIHNVPLMKPSEKAEIVDEDVPEEEEEEEGHGDAGEHANLIQPVYETLPPGFSAGPLLPPWQYKFVGGAFKAPDINPDILFSGDKDLSEPDIHRTPSLHTLGDEGAGSKQSLKLQRSRKATRPLSSRKNSSSDLSNNETLNAHSSEMTLQVTKTLSRSRSIHLDEDQRPSPSRSLDLDDIPQLAPLNIVKKRSDAAILTPEVPTSTSPSPPPVPPHRTPTTSQKTPSSQPSPPSSVRSGLQGKRRTSSPLKHEYAPSSASESDEEGGGAQVSSEAGSDEGTVTGSSTVSSVSSDDETSTESETESESDESLCSEEEMDGEYPMPTLAIETKTVSRQPSRVIPVQRLRKSSSSAEIETVESDEESEAEATTVRPNEFGPSVPSIVSRPAATIPTSNFRAMIFKWAVNCWEKYYPTDCKITIMPGRLEVYPMLDNESDSKNNGDLLFTLDLTLGTPINRGTAVDINIRTSKSSPLKGANVMLRTRSTGECDQLLRTMDMNRVYPVNFQASSTSVNTASVPPSEMETVTSATGSTSFAGSIRRGFSLRRRTYRAESTATPSLMSTPSATSIGSFASAFSRFRRGGNLFKPSVLSSTASSSSTNVTDSNGSSTPTDIPSLQSLGIDDLENCVPAVAPMKMRFFRRKTASDWRDLGQCRLHVFKPLDRSAPIVPGFSRPNFSRIIITNKKGTRLFLDEVLGETAFERVQRTGIAINILEKEGDEDGVVEASGGIGAKNQIFMMWMKGEAEAAYGFSILGRHRY
ncbi:hypothetical protein EX30DRAFT_397469 [Ascodesmis nigricans]|uniref:DH domain-containing protein n=1 Tax=Ascodesmis nigricans TaxID=341454 RepID=A0A4S2MSL0_9PEZI|nr:hypothetical protein EX30DRAFT_397469 [Ascodesmis nigricans]